MKELEKEFDGRGQVKGFRFTQIKQNQEAFIYMVNTGTSIHYEVFKRKINTQYNCISYPSDKAFGVWAWSANTIESSLDRFENITLNAQTISLIKNV